MGNLLYSKNITKEDEVVRGLGSQQCFCGKHLQTRPENQPPQSEGVCDICYYRLKPNDATMHCSAGPSECHPDGLDLCNRCLSANGRADKDLVTGVRVQVRSKVTKPTYGWRKTRAEMIGVIASCKDGTVYVTFPGMYTWRSNIGELQSVALTSGMRVQSPREAMVGVVQSINSDSGQIMVKYPNLAALVPCSSAELTAHPGPGALKVKTVVRIRQEVKKPMRGWGKLDHNSVGVLRRIGADGSVTLDLKGYSSEDGDLTWEGMVGEIEEIDTIQKQGIVVGASSGDATLLFDSLEDTYWESSGVKDSHVITIKLPEDATELNSLEILLGSEPYDYLPSKIVIDLGHVDDLAEVRTEYVKGIGWSPLTQRPIAKRFNIIQLRILSCHYNGIDCRIRGLRFAVSPRDYSAAAGRWPGLAYHPRPSGQVAVGGESLPTARELREEVQLAADLKIKNQYVLTKPVGKGGFGVTWLAKDKDCKNREVVLKFLINKGQKHEQLFENEAQKLLELNHPQIPRLHAFFVDENLQKVVLVMEQVIGDNLYQIRQRGEMPDAEIMSIVSDLLGILDYVHSQKVIHCDIKGENVMRNKDGRLYLIDFGSCTEVGSAISAFTPGYAAPEIGVRRPCYASDYFSVGATGLFLVTGKHPEDCLDTLDLLKRKNAISDDLFDLLSALTQEDPNDRTTMVAAVRAETLERRQKALSEPGRPSDGLPNRDDPRRATLQ